MDLAPSSRYQKISIEGKQIRLLVITRVLSTSAQFNLEIVLLNNCKDYTALSYTWGDNDSTYSIQTKDRNVYKITLNLNSALQHLCQIRERTMIWVDSICINQADPLEHASQVKMIRDIYQKAKEVVV